MKENVVLIKNKKILQIYDDYNITFINERTIEIPFTKNLILEFIDNYENPNILEVGNTLTHYEENKSKIKRTILDKYEKYPGVVNQDIKDFSPIEKFDLIFSISTLEHVGSDYEESNDENKFIESVNNCLRLLNKGGVFIVTLPIFYINNVDYFIFNEKKFINKYFFQRKNFKNDWKFSNQKDILKNKRKLIYNSTYPCANALFVGVIKK